MWEYEKHPLYLEAQDLLNIAFVLAANHEISLELGVEVVKVAIMRRKQ